MYTASNPRNEPSSLYLYEFSEYPVDGSNYLLHNRSSATGFQDLGCGTSPSISDPFDKTTTYIQITPSYLPPGMKVYYQIGPNPVINFNLPHDPQNYGGILPSQDGVALRLLVPVTPGYRLACIVFPN